MSQGSSRAQRELLTKFQALDGDAQRMLLEFLEFLHQRRAAPPTASEPLDIERPASESVVEAMRRLTRTYPMLDADPLLHRASDLMSQHVMGSRPAAGVIDDLETLFGEQYRAWRDASMRDEGDHR